MIYGAEYYLRVRTRKTYFPISTIQTKREIQRKRSVLSTLLYQLSVDDVSIPSFSNARTDTMSVQPSTAVRLARRNDQWRSSDVHFVE